MFGVQGFQANVRDNVIVSIDREIPPEKQHLDFSLFWGVWDTLDSRYFDKAKLNDSEMVYGAIKGMVSAVGDPYTIFLPPKENEVVQGDLHGEFGGVGIQIGFIGSQLAVIAPLADSPAGRAGVLAGDYIVGIKDEGKGIDIGTVGITLPQAVQHIRGKEGTSVTLTLLRNGEEDAIVVDLVRDTIEVPSIVVEYLENADTDVSENIAHIKLLKFSGETEKDWDDTVLELLRQPRLDGIILDVRNNPGGYLQGSVILASDFLDMGEVVVIEEDGGGNKIEFKVERIGRLRNQNIIVLMNRGSASASEILAGALRDQKGTLLVGENTFGKGTIQESQQVDGGAALHITFARWLTPKGTWVNEIGLKPDILVENDPDTPDDEQLQEAIRLLTN